MRLERAESDAVVARTAVGALKVAAVVEAIVAARVAQPVVVQVDVGRLLLLHAAAEAEAGLGVVDVGRHRQARLAAGQVEGGGDRRQRRRANGGGDADQQQQPGGGVLGVAALAEEGHGFLVIANNFNNERMAMSVMMEANARVCLEDAVSWARERKTFGKRLADQEW